jgi:ABC-2 type transport system permease protein
VLTDVLRFEWRYHTRQISFAAATLLFAGIGFLLTATRFGPDNVHLNSPYSIAESLGLASLAAVFAIAVFCANAVVRDRDHQMEEIVFSTAVEKREYLFGRFAGSFLAAFTAFSATAAGMMIAAAMPWHDPARVGPLSPWAYLWVLLVMVLPGMLAAAVILFGIATLTRSVLASVVGAVAIYVLYFVAAAFTNSPLMAASKPGADTMAAASLLDPFGLSAFFEQTRFWTPAARNVQWVALSGNFLLSRLLWLAFAAIVWLLVYRRFSFRLLESGRPARSRRATKIASLDADVSAHDSGRRAGCPATAGGTPALHEVPVSLAMPAQWKAFFAATRLELRAWLRSVPFLLLNLLWAGLAAAEILADVAGGEHGSALYPATGFILTTIQRPLTLVGMVLIVYYSAEMIWRERTLGMADLLHATPAPNAVFVLGKWIALSALTTTLVLSGTAVAALVQLLKGYTNLEPALMLAFAWFAAAPLMIFAMAAVLIQTLSPHKYFGMLLVLLLAVVMQAGGLLGLSHPLLRFGSVPGIEHSGMNGFGPYVAPFQWCTLLWAAAGALMLLAAAALWRRASGDRARGVLRTIVRTSTFTGRAAASALALTVFLAGGYIFYNTNVLNAWSSAATLADWRADYEKRYLPDSRIAEPRVAAIRAEIALYPKERRFQVRGTMDLINETAAPIGQLLVSVRRDVRVTSLALASARLQTYDARFATYRFKLDRPLPPQKRVALQLDLAADHRGFEAGGPDNAMAANGSFLFDSRLFPTLGYRKSYELRDPNERKKRGLKPLPAEGESGDVEPGDQWVDFDVTLSTEPDQIALAPGRLVREWSSGGRRYFHYRSDRLMHDVAVFTSARYATAAAGRVIVYYHPTHGANVARILAAANESLAYFGRSFGPYPHADLRIAEVPSYWPMGGFATPGFVVLSENRTFLIDARDPARLDLVTRRTAHEVAHQWWGHLVAPPEASGASTIVETLAKYSELLILEKKYGRASVRRSLSEELDLYLAGRTDDDRPEVSLARANGQPYLFYRKGAIVIYALKDLLGEEPLNRALRSFVAAQGGPGRKPGIDDLLRELENAAPAEQKGLVSRSIAEWMRDIVLYDLRLDSAKTRRLADGRYEVTLKVSASKDRVNASGSETALPFDEAIDVGIFTTDPDDAAPDATLHLARHTLHGGPNTLAVIVDKPPVFAAIDPYVTRVDRNRFDNVRKVE